MAWALALVVFIGVGLPVAAWLVTHQFPPRAARRLGAGYDAIDKWLLDQYQLVPQDRWRVRNAVFQGTQLSDATLTPAAHGLAAHVLTGKLRMLRLSQISGWLNLLVGAGFAGLGIVVLVTNHGAAGLALGVLGLIGSGMFMFAGAVFAFQNPKQIRRNAAKALELNKES